MGELSSAAQAILQAWFSQKPTFAVMGEYSSGKSTLLNFLLVNNVLPTRVTATSMPPVWLTYSEKPESYVLSRRGRVKSFDLADLENQLGVDTLLLRVGVPSKVLMRVDIVDTPGISDARFPTGAMDFLSAFLDFVVWCTPASQAWRQSEKSTYLTLPSGLRKDSILAITRSDIVNRSSDLTKVMRRCEVETADLFGAVTPISATTAYFAQDKNGKIIDQLYWVASFAERFYNCLERSIASAEVKCLARETRNIAPKSEDVGSSNKEVTKKRSTTDNVVLKSPDKNARDEGTSSKGSGKQKKSVDLILSPWDHHFNIFLLEAGLTIIQQEMLKAVVYVERQNGASDLEMLDRLNESLETLQMPRRPSWDKLNELFAGKNKRVRDKHPGAIIEEAELTKGTEMANIDISELAQIGGFIGACLVDSETGLMMASEGGGELDLEAAGAANTEVVKAKLAAIQVLGLDDHIDDILITLGKQFHLIRPMEKTPTVFLYVALNKKLANLGMARVQVKKVEQSISL